MTNEELQQEVEKLQEQISKLSLKIYGIEAKKKPYEVKVPENIENYYFLDETGNIVYKALYSSNYQKKTFMHGLAFKTKEEAEQHDKERILLFKLHKWAEEHNGGWTPNWNDYEEKQYYVVYDYEEKQFYVRYEHYSETFTKLPYLKSYNLAEQFVEEFGEEIKEVLLQWMINNSYILR